MLAIGQGRVCDLSQAIFVTQVRASICEHRGLLRREEVDTWDITEGVHGLPVRSREHQAQQRGSPVSNR
jgi:hypothetical protein